MRAVARFTVAVLAVAVFIIPGHTGAQTVQDFVITSFTADYRLTNEDPQGRLYISETIELDFSAQNRGILRAVPSVYNDNDVNLSISEVKRDGQTEPFITYDENDNTVIRIGNPDITITGEHVYEIDYQVENVIGFFDGYDELFWDVNGDQWLQPFLDVEVELTTDATITDPGVTCFAGTYGSIEQDCEILQQTNGLTARTTREFGPSETLTIVAAFEKGYFTPLSWTERYRGLLLASPLVLLQGLFVRSAHKKWQRLGKDYKKRGVIAPFFGRPKGVSVMQASYVAENKLSTKHVSASIIDLAVRGYIKITERKDGRKTKHDLTLVKAPDNKLTVDEKKLITELIGKNVGATVELEAKKDKLYKTFEALKKTVDQRATKKGYYELSPKKAAGALGKQIGLGVVGLIAGLILAGFSSGVTAVTGIASMIMIAIYAALMTKRSTSGNLLVEHMQGLKLYLSKAEKDRIAQQDAVAAPLAPHSGQPVRDVKFFEKLLPFAVAAGVEKTWAKAFEGIYTQPPEWYSGNWNAFTTGALVGSINSATKAASTSFTAPSSSGSSGFSGGGFSGGGGGGGGGGGW